MAAFASAVGNHRGGRGDSAGGNLSAVVCAETLDDENGPPDFQLLFFPVTDVSTKHASYRLFSDGYFLTEKQMDWYIGHYLPNPSDRTDPRASPLLGDPTGHPPAHVAVSGFDVLRDEGIAYAKKLRAADVPTSLQVVEGHIHAFVNATGVGNGANGRWPKPWPLSAGMQQARERASRESAESHGGRAGVSRTPGFRGGKVFVGSRSGRYSIERSGLARDPRICAPGRLRNGCGAVSSAPARRTCATTFVAWWVNRGSGRAPTPQGRACRAPELRQAGRDPGWSQAVHHVPRHWQPHRRARGRNR